MRVPITQRCHREGECRDESGPHCELCVECSRNCGSCRRHELFRKAGKESEHDSDQRQGGRRCQQAPSCAGGSGCSLSAWLAGAEGSDEKADGVGHGEHRGSRRDEDEWQTLLDESIEGSLLRSEAERQWEGGHRRRRGDRRPEHGRLAGAKPAEPSDVAGSRELVDHSNGHEQAGLERGVSDQQCQPPERQVAVACADQHEQEPELGDRAVCQEQLEIRLAECSPTAEQHRGEPDRRDRRKPPCRRHGSDEPELANEEDACLHHGRGVQERAGRGRGSHRAREPSMEWELSRLGDCANQDQRECRRGRRPGLERSAQFGDEVGPGLSGEQHQSSEKSESSRSGHECGMRARPTVPVRGGRSIRSTGMR